MRLGRGFVCPDHPRALQWLRRIAITDSTHILDFRRSGSDGIRADPVHLANEIDVFGYANPANFAASYDMGGLMTTSGKDPAKSVRIVRSMA